MPRLQSEGALVIEDSFSEITQAVPGVTEIVKEVRVQASFVHEALVTGCRFFKPPIRIGGIRLCEATFFCGGLRQRRGKSRGDGRDAKQMPYFHGRKVSINSRTSFRVSRGSSRIPFCPPL